MKTLYSDLSDIVYSYCLAFTLFSGSYLTSLQGIIHPLSFIIIIIIKWHKYTSCALEDFGVQQFRSYSYKITSQVVAIKLYKLLNTAEKLKHNHMNKSFN